ncbi:hypothetical protein Syun_020740 [Stephania yunnanensis]|uniref:Uncharacterized protein n=1 Tax=Stephania yunnanensis TaxID=152371 RepID=A0AAP0IF65_9MAGN
MEEAKAAAYCEELTRKGEGAARFKHGLGFSSSSSPSSNPVRGSALASFSSSSSSSFLSTFVRASSPSSTKSSDLDKQAQLQSIQNKLKKKPTDEEKSLARDSVGRERDRGGIRSSSRERERSLRKRSRDRSGSRRRDRSSSRERRKRRRSRSRSRSYEERRRRRRSRSRSRSASPPRRRSEKSRDYGMKDRRDDKGHKERTGGVDYERLIDGYAEMNQAERIKAKMKLQLSQTVEKDNKKGTGWERFEFNKDAPLDDEEIEAAEDDAKLVKNIGQSFRFSALEARRDEQIRTAHDEAMFGVPMAQSSILTRGDAMFGPPAAQPPSVPSDEEPTIVDAIEYNTDKKEVSKNGAVTDLLSDKVIAKQQGSWRDRARILQNGSKS